MKKLISGLLSLCFAVTASAAEKSVNSPDGRLVVTVSDEGGKPSYSVAYDGVPFLMKSPLGLMMNIGDFTEGMELAQASDVALIQDTYSLPNIKKSNVSYKANRQEFTFNKDGKPVYDIIFQVADNDIAFKYRLHVQGTSRSCVIMKEATGFVLPDGSTTFLSPQAKAMEGWSRTYPSYEKPYTTDGALGENGEGEGYVFPCLFRNNDNGWVLISETGTRGNYCGCRLIGGNGSLYTIGFPQETELNGLGRANPGMPLPGETPWRTITVGKNLKPIVETTIPFDVVEPRYEASKEYEYGKGSWSWIIGMDGATNYDEQIRYIDFSAAMGYRSILVDALWDTQIGYDGIEKLAKYGAEKGVGLYLWYNSNGCWNDAPQGPRGKMDNIVDRRKEMAWMRSVGVKGIKVDFFGGDKQQTMQLYEDILTDANDYGLLVIFHGCTLPRGWDRMYPNYAASEAVLASENLHFSQGSCDTEARDACVHPFIRNTVGSMDFGGSTLNKFYNYKNEPNRGSERRTSDVFALATAVLFQSPVQHFAMAPNNLTDAPAWAVDFMKKVPSTWDDIRFIDGYPGKYVIFARRSEGVWYIAGINARKETLNLKVKLPMLRAGSDLTVYSDDSELNGSVRTVELSKNQELEITIPCEGGFVAVAGNEPVYMFSYFIGNGEDGLHLAYSYDGLKWTSLKEGKSFLTPAVGDDKLMRDPSVCQAPDGTFHMVWTSSWTDRIIGYASSKDLIHWSEQKGIPVMMHEPEAHNCWAPELFYDSRSKTYYIFWATTIPGRHKEVATSESEKGLNHRMYYVTTKDFKTFSKTKMFFNPDFSVIDAAVVKDELNNDYIMIVKNENSNPAEKNLRVTRTKNIAKGFPIEVSAPINGDYWCEGPTPIFVGDDLYVYFDKYTQHKYGAVKSSDCGKTWEDVSDRVSFPKGTRHGTAFKVERSVLNKLMEK